VTLDLLFTTRVGRGAGSPGKREVLHQKKKKANGRSGKITGPRGKKKSQ